MKITLKKEIRVFQIYVVQKDKLTKKKINTMIMVVFLKSMVANNMQVVFRINVISVILDLPLKGPKTNTIPVIVMVLGIQWTLKRSTVDRLL